ncbi:YIP1 family protein [Poriferisphaera sp. WC338]|uniref:YIP1 family protein n=1 Tax=Poriferisphaera sp. WC338 TaxID=3425129 RepID=UPI003D814797
MNCKECGYRLWNITSRECPECGTPFLPSEFEFAANAVQYLCPHCSQPYFGTGLNGHLVPRDFDCISCHNHIHMDEMVLLPTEGVSEETTKVSRNPWVDETEKRGLIGKWRSTAWRSLFSPAPLINATPSTASTTAALGYLLATISVTLLPIVLIIIVITAIVGISSGSGSATLGAASGFSIFVGVTVLVLFGISIIWAISTHLILKVSSKPVYTFSRTFQTFAYAATPILFLAIPCLNLLLYPVALIWWCVTAAVMLGPAQKVSGTRATLAVLIPPFVLLLLIMAASISFSYYVTINSPFSTSTPSTSRISQVLQSQKNNTGLYPQHIVALIDNQNLSSDDFISGFYNTTFTDAQIGHHTLQDFLPENNPNFDQLRACAIETVIDPVPDDIIQYRVGDFVFTYPGTENINDPDLWIFIEYPAPIANKSPTSQTLARIYTADGNMETTFGSSFKYALGAQNRLRAKYNLSSLMHPKDVTSSLVVMPQNNTSNTPVTYDIPTNTDHEEPEIPSP